ISKDIDALNQADSDPPGCLTTGPAKGRSEDDVKSLFILHDDGGAMPRLLCRRDFIRMSILGTVKIITLFQVGQASPPTISFLLQQHRASFALSKTDFRHFTVSRLRQDIFIQNNRNVRALRNKQIYVIAENRDFVLPSRPQSGRFFSPLLIFENPFSQAARHLDRHNPLPQHHQPPHSRRIMVGKSPCRIRASGKTGGDQYAGSYSDTPDQ
ncbi:MAG TPA: hypothetical protein VLD55_13650, partial [Candidatus Sulfobium mesophilum]|nr:hypothetical protein [Candidatus Sulfobium mesophilum]